LETAGIILKPGSTKNKKQSVKNKVKKEKMTAGQIKKAIEIAVKNEDYELAAQLRDELNKKND
jgi:protein-arginine kinase activator protein McsA